MVGRRQGLNRELGSMDCHPGGCAAEMTWEAGRLKSYPEEGAETEQSERGSGGS
jgi:hypothetical protein